MRITCVRAVLILVFLFVPTLASAGGNPEVGLPKVDRLIKDRNYNEALLALAEYMDEHPEDFDGAQRRIRRIIELRESYNTKAEDLLKVLTEEPTNDKKKLDMITAMEALEKNPNPSTQNFIKDTKAAAQFTFYRAKFDEIMRDGNAYIDSSLYANAARTFAEGYIIYKQEFDETSEPSLVASVDSVLGETGTLIASFEASVPKLSEAAQLFSGVLREGSDSSLPPDIERAEAVWNSLAVELKRMSEIRNRIAEIGWYYEDVFARMSETDEIVTENSFLPFAYRFTLGRKTGFRYEGILGSIDALINPVLAEVDALCAAALDRSWQSAVRDLESGALSSGTARIAETARFAALGSAFVDTASLSVYRDDTWGRTDRTGSSTLYVHAAACSGILNELAELAARKNDLDSRVPLLPEDSPNSAAFRGGAVRFVTERDALSKEAASLEQLMLQGRDDSRNALSAASGVTTGFTSDIERWNDTLRSGLADLQKKVYTEAVLWYASAAGNAIGERRVSWSDSLALLEGVPQPDSVTVFYYPAESLAAFTGLRSAAAKDKTSVQSALSWAREIPARFRESEGIRSGITSLESMIAYLDRLDSDIASASARANSRILQANLAKQESELRYSQALASLKRNDFQSARDNLQRSREKANQSLSWQESKTFRTETDRKLEQLGTDITRTENEAVVREVRILISSGKNFYYQGNFDQAEQVLNQAKARWSVTNIEPNVEVTNWLAIVNTALSMKTGRTIPVSAPLYPQMSQLLSSANQLYTEGKELIEKGKRTQAIELLTQAKEKLQQLKLVYPLNEDAGQLTLKIDQVIDPAAFKVSFRQKVETARATYRSEPQKAYSELLDLYKLDPAYPGIKRLVDEIEVYLGIQIPPPDPKALARSSELTRSAQKIYDANTRSMFQIALDQLDEAIKLNPDNQNAIALKDRVQTAIGGQSVAVLSGNDEAKYQQAVLELQKGNKITASALVEQLLQNPKSRNSAKIQDLKKRIDSQL